MPSENTATLATIVPPKVADKFRKIAKRNVRSPAAELRSLILRHVEENK